MAVVFLIEPSREDIASAQRGCLNTLDIIEKMMLYTKVGFMMLDIEKIEMEEALKNKIEFICSFCNTTPIIYNGNIKMIEHTNLQYVEPHRIIIKGITFLAFNYENTLYIENLSNAIPLNDLEQYIKSI